MVYSQKSFIRFAALLLTAAAVSPVAHEFLVSGVALAQSFGDNPEGFPIPSTLPTGSTLRVDGSTSMQVTNEELERRFEAQYPDIDVTLAASRTDEAIAALVSGDLDLVATGRPLTAAEKAQGLVEIPLEREKLAILLGPDNDFDGNLTFAQFAQIFRGEITNWSAVGGPNLPIRVVDRPEYSDTRRALSTYDVFAGSPFATGSTADPIATDDTADVLAALGNDGIGYAVFSQVQGLDVVQVLPMHGTLPDDPRYPYSQYRAYVYKEDASPAVLAFLGFATTAPGQEAITPAAGAATSTEADSPPAAEADPSTEAADADAGATPTEEETALIPDADPAETTRGSGFPWWLLGLPLLGGLLWWWLKGRGGAVPLAAPIAAPVAVAAEPRMILTPRDCRDAYAYWEVPSDRLAAARQEGNQIKVRLYDVTGRVKDTALPPPTAEFDCVGDEPDLHLPIRMDDRDYRAEVGYLTPDQRWHSLAKSDAVRVPACPQPASVNANASAAAAKAGTGVGAAGLGAAAIGTAGLGAAAIAAAGLGAAAATKPAASRIILTPRSHQDAYAYWEIPADAPQGKVRSVRLYDVTGRPPTATLPDPVGEFAWVGPEPDLHLPIATPDRDYVAAIGDSTADQGWRPLAQSAPVHVPAAPQAAVPSEANARATFPDLAIPGAVAAGAAAIGAAAVGLGQRVAAPAPSRIILTPRTAQKAYAYWEVPDTAKAATKAKGGQTYQLRIADVTALAATQPPHSVLTYDIAETDCDRFVPLPASDRDYCAEVGYCTAAGDWLGLARSAPVRASQVLGSPVAAAIGAVGVAAATGVIAPAAPAVPRQGRCTLQTVNVHSRHQAVELGADSMRHLQDAVAAKAELTPGLYVLRLRDGAFNYDGDDTHPGEPFVLLWIYGGQVVNRKTGVPVAATWSTLNGYADTLTLDVQEPVQLCAFFMDTFPDDNVGEVTLSVIKL